MGLFITSIILVLTISFFCSLAEAVILSANISTQVGDPLKPGDKKLADTWKKLRRNISKPIAAILIFNTIANTGGSVVAGSAFRDIFGNEKLCYQNNPEQFRDVHFAKEEKCLRYETLKARLLQLLAS